VAIGISCGRAYGTGGLGDGPCGACGCCAYAESVRLLRVRGERDERGSAGRDVATEIDAERHGTERQRLGRDARTTGSRPVPAARHTTAGLCKRS